jgi:hypothetical protein
MDQYFEWHYSTFIPGAVAKNATSWLGGLINIEKFTLEISSTNSLFYRMR